MIKVSDEKFYPPKPKPDFLAQKGGKTPQISQKLNQLGFDSNFQRKLKPINDQSWGQKMLPLPQAKTRFFAQKGVKIPKNQPKTQPTRIWLKFSG